MAGVPGIRIGGRQKGTPNKSTLLRQGELGAGGELPLEYMLRVMRDETIEEKRRDVMSHAAAPYIHQKLAAMEVTGKDGKDLIPQATDEDRAKALAVLLAKAAAEEKK
jgi:hypothetical protein